MADTAGLALGTISLAIQVCKGIITYADAIRGKTNALAGLDRKAKTLSQILEILGQILRRIQLTATNARSTTTVSLLTTIASSIRSCAADLKELEGFLEKHTAGNRTSSSNFRATCEDAYKSLKYGFRAAEVVELEQRLASVTSLLVAGMGTLNTDLLLDLAEQSRSLHANSIDATNTLADQAQSIESMQASSASHLEKLGNLHHAFQQLKEPLVDLVQATSSDIHEHISESSTSITGLITMRSRDMEDLAVANQTMVLNELAALKDTVEALASGLENLPSSERNAVSVRRLVSQPALLRDAMDAQAQANDTRESQTRSPLVVGFANLIPCDCRGYRSLSSSGFRTKTTQFSWVRQDIYRHSPQCRFYASVNLNKTTKLSAEANFKTFNMLMRRALKITISLPWGAGGLGIGAQLSTRAIVDVGRSPSFQIIKWIGTALLSKSMSSGVQPRELIEDLVIIALGKLKEIFGCGKSSPRDVNMDGQTLLSFFLVMLEGPAWREEELETMTLIIWHLIHTFHISRAYADRYNNIPLIDALDFQNKAMIEALIPRSDEASDETWSSCTADARALSAFPSIAAAICTVYGVDPLSEAILCGQPGQVIKLISEHPVLLDETPPFGCPTHLHLAASAGLGFAELLGELKRAARAGDTISAAHLSRALRFAGPFDETLAEYIMWACDTKYERSQQGTFQCRYALALTELIKLKCDMSPDSFGLDVRRHNRRQSCPACVEAYFSELDKRLQLLKSIGLECLSPDQVTAFKLDEGKLLVQHTYSVIEALEELSVPIPRHVRTSCNLLPSSSIWMVRSLTMQLLAIFFKAGLQDRAEPFERGCIALEQLIEELASYRRTYMGKSQTKEIYSKMIWILEHSPGDILERPWQYHHRGLGHVSCSLCRLVDLGHKPTIGHALAVVLGQSLGSLEAEAEADEDWWDDWYLRDHWQLLTNKVLHMSISDRSSCLCSKMGREPFDLLWREFVGPITDNNSPSVLALEIHDFAQAYGHGLRFRHLRAAVRYLTFEVLSLQHTCGRILDEDRLDEAEELVNDQQRTQLFHEIQEWLDEILVEELGSRHGSEASDDSKARRSVASDKGEDDQPRSSRSVDDEGLSSISASSKHTDSSESDSSDVSISEDTWLDLLFTWGDRMELELEGMFLQSVRENHTQAAENIGVSWCRPPPKVEPEESFSPPYGSKEYWLLTLEKIWPERKA